MTKTENYRFFYTDSGDKGNPPILFLHGFLGSHLDWDPILPTLNRHFRCISIDLPGHGSTKIFGDDLSYSVEETACRLVALLHELKITSCFLVGYSMGGRLALYLALNYSEIFKATIIESGSPGLKNASERDLRIESDLKLANNLERENFTDFLTFWYDQPLFDTFRALPNFEKIFTTRLNSNPIELAKSLRAIGTGTQPSLWDALSTSEAKLLFLAGDLDKKFSLIAEEAANQSTSAEYKIVECSGHTIHWEQPEIFIQEVHFLFQS